MGFEVSKVKAISFESIDEVLAHVEQEQKNIARISIMDLIEKGAFFFGDKYFGNSDFKLTLNEPALNDLFRWLDFYSSSFLHRLEKNELASEVLTDLVRSPQGKSKLQNAEFVFDDSSKNIVGVVSNTYVGYSNKKFLEDIEDCLSSKKTQRTLFKEMADFEFQTSYSINTHLHLRLLHKKTIGVIRGKGGEGDDISKLGFQLSNAMSGGKALKMDYFVHRLICNNGLIVPISGVQSRLIHSGKEENFQKRLLEKINDVVGSLVTAKKLIENLGDINYIPEKMVNYPELGKLFEAVPNKNLKKEAMQSFSFDTLNELETFKKDKIKYENKTNIEVIKQIPSLIGGEHSNKVFNSHWRDNASMFDFINLFTEEAQNYKPEQRLNIEKEAGNLANFIIKNKKMFV